MLVSAPCKKSCPVKKRTIPTPTSQSPARPARLTRLRHARCLRAFLLPSSPRLPPSLVELRRTGLRTGRSTSFRLRPVGLRRDKSKDRQLHQSFHPTCALGTFYIPSAAPGFRAAQIHHTKVAVRPHGQSRPPGGTLVRASPPSPTVCSRCSSAGP